jgi:hypothetical protein
LRTATHQGNYWLGADMFCIKILTNGLNQKQRAEILFVYPDIYQAYNLSQQLNQIYEKTNAYTRLENGMKRSLSPDLNHSI